MLLMVARLLKFVGRVTVAHDVVWKYEYVPVAAARKTMMDFSLRSRVNLVM